MATIDDLISNIMGQTDQALNAGPAPWQQELLESVNPEKVRRQNIARALAKASTAMATTPGNFLSGVAAATSTGADAYLTGRDEAEDQRIKVQQLLQMQQQKDQDRRLGLLMDALGVQRNQIQDRQSAETHAATMDERKARTDYYNRRGAGNSAGLTQSQILTTKRAIRGELRTLENQLNESARLDESLTPEAIQQALDERRLELESYYGISLDSPDVPSGGGAGGNVSQSDLFTPGGSSPGGGTAQVLTPEQYEGILPQQAQPPSNQSGVGVNSKPEATKTINGKTYVKINGKWFEQR